jgi:hypothetical protein
MVRSRLEAAAGSDVELIYLGSAAELPAALDPPPDLVVVGLAATRLPWPVLVQAMTSGSVRPRGVAFGAHLGLALRERALAAGVDEVVANSTFMRGLSSLLRGGSLRGGEA